MQIIQLQALTSNFNYKPQLQAPALTELGPAQPQLVFCLYFLWVIVSFLCTFWLFLGLGWAPIRFWGLLILTDNFHFVIFLFCLLSKFMLFWPYSEPLWGLSCYCEGLGMVLRIFLGSAHIDWWLSLFFSDILTFCFWGSFWSFLGPTGLFLGWGRIQKFCWVLTM